MRSARDSPTPWPRRHDETRGRVEARGAHVLAGPFAPRRASEGTSERTGDSRCVAGTRSPSPPASHDVVIAAVRGSIITRAADHVIVESNGVGYKIYVPRQPARDEVLLHTHHIVREDEQSL